MAAKGLFAEERLHHKVMLLISARQLRWRRNINLAYHQKTTI
jgi:hypothetical protein